MKLNEFFDDDFKTFSNLDNVRSIPSIIDGFKDSQRKAIYGMMLNGNKLIKVAQAATAAALVTHYDHGEASMASTIVGLAQDFPGTNNVNLLEPSGQFGSILSSESASHRYIFTRPSENMRKYIRPEDDCILEHRYDDGDKFEPINYYPILPMWIVNGSVGIGTGHSVKILPRDPSNVAMMIERLVEGTNVQDRTIKRLLKPYYNGWTGEVIDGDEPGKYELHGVIEVVNTTTLRVTELPVGYGIDKFKAILVDLMDKGKVKDFDNNSTDKGFDIEIRVPREVGKQPIDELKKLFKLISRQSENVTMWNVNGKLEEFPSVFEALQQFVKFRIDRYEDQRQKRIEIINEQINFLENKKLFILEWNSLDNPGKMKSSDIEDHMIKKGVNKEYLSRFMAMRISSLTMDLIKELEVDLKKNKSNKSKLEKSEARGMFIADLDTL